MEVDPPTSSGGVLNVAAQPGTTKAKNDAKWDAMRERIHHIYVEENNTLSTTRDIIYKEYTFRAGTRKWKDKLKEWKFDKNLSIKDMQVVVAKQQKRAREGKDTVFIHGSAEITSERIENFKRRKVSKMPDAVSPSAETPENVTYSTPGPCSNDTEPAIYHVYNDFSVRDLLYDISERQHEINLDLEEISGIKRITGQLLSSWGHLTSPAMLSNEPSASAQVEELHDDHHSSPCQSTSELELVGNEIDDGPILDLMNLGHESHEELRTLEKILQRNNGTFCCFYEAQSITGNNILELDGLERIAVLHACLELRTGVLRERMIRSYINSGILRIVPLIISYSKSLISEDEHYQALGEAEAIFREGIKYFEKKVKFHCPCFFDLAMLLQSSERSRSDEIPRLLSSTLATKGPIWKIPSVAWCQCITAKAVQKLEEFYSEVDSRLWQSVIESLKVLHEMILLDKERPDSFFRPLSFKTHCYIVTLAGLFSQMLEFSIAHTILPEPNDVSSLCVLIRLQRSLNFQRQGELEKGLREVEAASYGFPKSTGIGSEWSEADLRDYVSFAKILLSKIKNNRIKPSILITMETKLDELLKGVPIKDKLSVAEEENHWEFLLDEPTEISLSDNASARYGVTYSVSTITGVSNSVFMVP
ncbi:hypothetical protein CJF32_00004115 [Rutstroemia sp. NJR-2017a WRK4]|nr:hypothetical protein CJF32_00004115 [Rutstroemia sp. NJR-2017a WRK4]